MHVHQIMQAKRVHPHGAPSAGGAGADAAGGREAAPGGGGAGLVGAYFEAGLSATTVAWALERPVAEILTRFRVLRGARRPSGPAESAPAPATPSAPVAAAPPRPRRAASSPIAEAERVLGERLDARDNDLRLDGRKATLSEVVQAAGALGARIPYPGLSPLPEAYHAGPSAALPKRPRARAAGSV